MIAADSRPRLAPGVRLRADLVRGGSMLLAPERGVALDETPSAILDLCSGERAVSAIVASLQRAYDAPRETVERDVLDLLRALEQRRFVVAEPAQGRP